MEEKINKSLEKVQIAWNDKIKDLQICFEA
jgi:hypothetical protein